MTATAVLYLTGLPVAVLIGLEAAAATRRLRRELANAGERLSVRVGRGTSLLLASSLASAGLIVFGLLMGWLAAALESPVDRPAFRWAISQFDRSPGFFQHTWYEWARLVTTMADSMQTRLLVIVAAVVLAIIWRRHRPWVPVVLIVGTYLVAYVAQKLLTRAVDRGHPPAEFGIVTLGTYPSGGCLRIVAVWGIIAVLLVRSFPNAPRRLAPSLAVMVAVASWTEAYTRLYLLKHWVTDVIGGLLLGSVLLLGAAVIAGSWIDRDAAVREPALSQ